jgi:hypothetical protein
MASLDFGIAPISVDSLKANTETVDSQTAPDPLTPKASKFHFGRNDIESSAGASTTIDPLLAKGPIDTSGLHELVANCAPAYYWLETSFIVANSELLPGAVESAVAEVMVLAVVDH